MDWAPKGNGSKAMTNASPNPWKEAIERKHQFAVFWIVKETEIQRTSYARRD